MAPTIPFPAQGAKRRSPHVVPAEESAHEATLMQWPVNRRVYPEGWFLKEVQATITTIANTISAFEPVYMLADAALHSQIKPKLTSNVRLFDVPTDDLWARDSGPLVALNHRNGRGVPHIQFNGWGNKQTCQEDAQVAVRMAKILDFDVISTGLTGEAGGVETNGAGLLMAHESSWLNPNRNPGMSLVDISQKLCDAYGAERILWAKGLKDHDITDYHIDALARFIAPNDVLINLAAQHDPLDPFQIAAQVTLAMLETEGLKITKISEPTVDAAKGEDFLPAYANYYVANGAVLCPKFNDPLPDQAAQEALQKAYPTREIITLNIDPIAELGGGIHCATQQIPSISVNAE